jgi:MoaA/NifB/PqqE/SkfB family radical SAM enzyme
MLWLDLTRKCQLACAHCYNASGPDGGQGTMTREDWLGVLDQAASVGVHRVQFIGGEPTMHPHFAELAAHALTAGLEVEVFSNLVHVPAECWELFQRGGVSLATSYYSDRASSHDAMTGRPSHARTRANIARAVRLRIPVRVGIIADEDDKRLEATRADLRGLGVTRIGVDHVRPFGRGAREGQEPDVSGLCGHCGNGRAAIGPDGTVSPCVFSGFIGVGNIHGAPLADILRGEAMTRANAAIRSARGVRACYPDRAPCGPDYNPPQTCGPDEDAECSPGTPPSTCNPRR